MGIPQSYSRELPERCMQLIDVLLPRAAELSVPGEAHLGPLTTTFLVAMATPMILLPLERIKRHREGVPGAYMNERPLNGALADAVDVALGAAPLQRSPFFRPAQWRFATIPYDGENVAEHFPEHLQDRLGDSAAEAAAARMPAEQWSGCLRNALAHGGIVYLDDTGRQSFGGRVTQLAFVSASYPRGEGR